MSEPPDLAQALLNPDFYPGTPSNIDLVQKATSWVFLTGEYAYKIKKPIDYGFLDYTTLEKRRFYCNREIVLNRRLCPDIYLDTVSITEDKNGISVEGKGKAIEYAVKMKQMPQSDMLDVLLQKNEVPDDAVERIARKLAEFHGKAGNNGTINDYGVMEFILTNTENNFLNTIRYISKTISQKRYRDIKDYTNRFIENNTALFYERIADNKIRDCHGDIRAKHICINGDVFIFDCIEFNDSLRYCDTASEIALLSFDLDRYDRHDLSRELEDTYAALTGDEDLPRIINFYKCYRACESGRLESMKLETPGITDEQTASLVDIASKCFELAESYIC